MIEALPDASINAIFEALQLDQPPALVGFVAEQPDAEEAEPDAAEVTPEATASSQRANALGQGNLRVNPLAMAALSAAIVNDGNAPHPHALQAVRPPESDTDAWQPVTFQQPGQAMLTAAVAGLLRATMQENLPVGVAQSAQRDDMQIGGHAALAYSGETTQAWFIGFIIVQGRLGAGVAIVLEDSSDLSRVAEIGGIALTAAHDALIPHLSP